MPKELLDKEDIERAITRMAHEIIEKNKGVRSLCLVGIQRGGVHLANRLAAKLKEIEGKGIPVGTLDISKYRDDISMRKVKVSREKNKMPCDVTDKKVVLVDDVLFTGRSIRAALDAIMDIDRPPSIQLAVLVDRGHRELPIKADFVGKNIPTSKSEHIEVEIDNTDTEDRVTIQQIKRIEEK